MSNTSIHFFQEDTLYRLENKRNIRSWINDSVRAESFVPGDLNIILCSDEFLYQMNVSHLQHDTYTDIITFDYSESPRVNGDLFISIDRVRENAKELKLPIAEELHRVIIHGVLHLCGYKDKSLKDSQLMRQKEDLYLSLRPF